MLPIQLEGKSWSTLPMQIKWQHGHLALLDSNYMFVFSIFDGWGDLKFWWTSYISIINKTNAI